MKMTGTTTTIITVKASISRPRSASAIGPLGLRMTARSQPPANRASSAIPATRNVTIACFTPPLAPFIEQRS